MPCPSLYGKAPILELCDPYQDMLDAHMQWRLSCIAQNGVDPKPETRMMLSEFDEIDVKTATRMAAEARMSMRIMARANRDTSSIHAETLEDYRLPNNEHS